ncbi:MAG: ankyrin repeat domain-containing protein [Planctomycetota bacterium]
MDLHEFARVGDIESVCNALSQGRSVDARDGHDWTPLAYAATSSDTDVAMVRLLIEAGADVNATVDQAKKRPLGLAACSGSQEKVRLLAEAGANARFVSENGYTVLINVVYALCDDERLVPMIELLTELGADPDSESRYGESPLSVSSRLGRFDAVQALLTAGADPSPLGWTRLMKAVALGTMDEVEQHLFEDSPRVHDRDRWERTPWLLACLVGDIEKAKRVLASGADLRDRERMGPDALGICAERGNSEMLLWLLQVGADADAADDVGSTALMLAAQAGNADCVRALLEGGANPNRKNNYGDSAMSMASSKVAMRLLMEAGERLAEINDELKREVLGLDGGTQLKVTATEYNAGCRPRYGRSNPEIMEVPFWHEMVRAGISAYSARAQFGDEIHVSRPTWCYSRFGVSLTELPDGRFVQIGGEHEDFYDPDFCIYNDVLVHEHGGRFQIMGYPKDVFPPSDFHTATYFGGAIYIVGGLGYQGSRRFGFTPIYRLDCHSWTIEELASTGDNPGWIYDHNARLDEDGTLVISDGKVCRQTIEGEDHVDNEVEFTLDLSGGTWTRA